MNLLVTNYSYIIIFIVFVFSKFFFAVDVVYLNDLNKFFYSLFGTYKVFEHKKGNLN